MPTRNIYVDGRNVYHKSWKLFIYLKPKRLLSSPFRQQQQRRFPVVQETCFSGESVSFGT